MALKKSQLYSSLWRSCDELRGGMDASQYKDYVLTLLFMKYVSDRHAGRPDTLIDIPAGGGFADIAALKGAIILPHGVLFRGNREADIRRNLVGRGLVKGIIGLPPNLFYGTGIPACIVIIDKENAHARRGIFMVDASRGFRKDGNKNRLRAQDIHRIVDVFNSQTEAPRYARMVPVSEIADPANDYNLNIPRYVELFTDRLEEVWNPGSLPPPLTVDRLRVPHESVATNPLLARALYLAKYIEHVGTGTLDMITRCVEAGRREPEFGVTGRFVTRIRRVALAGQPVMFTGPEAVRGSAYRNRWLHA